MWLQFWNSSLLLLSYAHLKKEELSKLADLSGHRRDADGSKHSADPEIELRVTVISNGAS